MYMQPQSPAQHRIDGGAEKSTAAQRNVAARLSEISHRYAWHDREQRKRRRHSVIVTIRMRELERLFAFRYGPTLPDDDAGRDDALVMAHHIAQLGMPQGHIPAWLAIWAPWMSKVECAALVARVVKAPLRWTADGLATRVGLDAATRTTLMITTIGSYDTSKDERVESRRQRDKEGHQTRRRKAGAVSRAEYETGSAARAEPWRAMGMSRRSWYRKGKPSPAPSQPVAQVQKLAQVRLQQIDTTMLTTDLCHSTGSAITTPSQRKFRAPRSSARAAEVPSPPITPAPINERVTKRYKSSERAAVTPARAQVEELMLQALSLTQSTLPVQRYNPSHMKGATMTEPNPVETLIYNALDATTQRRRDSVMRDQYIRALMLHPSWQRSDVGFMCDDDAPSMSAEALIEWLQREHPAEARAIEREHAA